MSIFKVSELRKKTINELTSQYEDLSKEKFNLRFQKSNGQIKNTGRIKLVRREIARIQTLINEKSEK